MGSCCDYSALERYVKKHGEEIKKEYEKKILGKKVVSFNSTEIDYWIQGNATLSDGSVFTTHFRWASEEEDSTGIEDFNSESDGISMEKYYNSHIVGKIIYKISVGYERDDMVYVYAHVDEINEDYCLEIPLGVIPENINYDGDCLL